MTNGTRIDDIEANIKSCQTAVNAENVGGVYFLFDGDEVVYIGQTKNVYARIAQHYATRRISFTHYGFTSVSSDCRIETERALIKKYSPKCNRRPLSRSERNKTSLLTLDYTFSVDRLH